jgi:hypothetical protein
MIRRQRYFVRYGGLVHWAVMDWLIHKLERRTADAARRLTPFNRSPFRPGALLAGAFYCAGYFGSSAIIFARHRSAFA